MSLERTKKKSLTSNVMQDLQLQTIANLLFVGADQWPQQLKIKHAENQRDDSSGSLTGCVRGKWIIKKIKNQKKYSQIFWNILSPPSAIYCTLSGLSSIYRQRMVGGQKKTPLNKVEEHVTTRCQENMWGTVRLDTAVWTREKCKIKDCESHQKDRSGIQLINENEMQCKFCQVKLKSEKAWCVFLALSHCVCECM